MSEIPQTLPPQMDSKPESKLQQIPKFSKIWGVSFGHSGSNKSLMWGRSCSLYQTKKGVRLAENTKIFKDLRGFLFFFLWFPKGSKGAPTVYWIYSTLIFCGLGTNWFQHHQHSPHQQEAAEFVPWAQIFYCYWKQGNFQGVLSLLLPSHLQNTQFKFSLKVHCEKMRIFKHLV